MSARQGGGMVRAVVAASFAATLAACTASPPAQAPRVVAPPPQATPQRPPAKPVWTLQPVVADAPEVAAQTLVVQRGDSLSAIAARTGSSVGAIVVANGIATPDRIAPGQRLTIPGGRYHRIKRGETGITIARAYGVRWREVVAANGLVEPYVLEVGERLLLPSRAAVDSRSIEDRAAAFTIDIDDLISGSAPAEAARPGSPARAAPASPAAAISFAWPVEGRILSRFGSKGAGRVNDGINIKASAGAPFRAAADGVVAYAGDAIEGFGNLLLIKHPGGWMTAYAHAEALLVTRGKSVTKGEIVGRVGQTGSVDEPQLHFELRRGRVPVNPVSHLPAGS